MKKLLVAAAAIAALTVTPAHARGLGGVGAGLAAGIIAGVIASQARPQVVYVYPRVRPRVQRPDVKRRSSVMKAEAGRH